MAYLTGKREALTVATLERKRYGVCMGGQGPEGLFDGAFVSAALQALVWDSPSYVTCIDRQRRILFVNRGISREVADLVGKPVDDFVAAAHRETVVTCIERAFATGRMQLCEYDVVLVDDTRHYLRSRVLPFATPSGDQAALMITEDDTERHSLSAQLAQSMEFQRRVVENLPGFVALVDRDCRFVWVNKVAPGLRMTEVIGTSVEKFVTPDHMPTVRAAIDSVFQTGNSTQYEVEGYADSQRKAWYQTRVVPVLIDGKMEQVMVLTNDVTELKHAEESLRETQEQLHRAQRLESIGQLAGGIAHDFNNLLQVIAGNLSFARHGLSAGRSVSGELDLALRATERAAELTTHLLAVGRRQRVDSKRVELGQLVADSMRMLRRTIPENIELKYDAADEPCFAELDAPQFEQVLINLCVNARDAMPHGGTLTVRIEPRGWDAVVLSVVDTGLGIAKEHLGRVFEPFYTTKGTGSGLGLAVAAGIVAAHGGSITAESESGHGTVMKVTLPRSTPAAPPKPLSSKPNAGGEGLILVAEDEELVRAQVVRILEEAGYTVSQAENGAQAVELFARHEHEIMLVVLDVVMPVLDGWQAFLKMRERQAGLHALFTTGYAASVLPEDFAAHGARLLSKPFTPSQLLAQVRELLDQVGVITG